MGIFMNFFLYHVLIIKRKMFSLTAYHRLRGLGVEGVVGRSEKGRAQQ